MCLTRTSAFIWTVMGAVLLYRLS